MHSLPITDDASLQHLWALLDGAPTAALEGETWIVERFDYPNRKAWVRRIDSDYFTEAATDTEVRVTRLESKLARERSAAPVADPVPVATPPEDLAPDAEGDEDGEDFSTWLLFDNYSHGQP